MLRWVVFLGFCCLAVLARSAHVSADAPEASYERLIGAGVAAFNAGSYREAKELFEQAHAQNKNARTFFHMAKVDFELKEYVLSMHELEQALESNDVPLSTNPELLKEANELLRTLRRFVSYVNITLLPAAAELKLDGKPLLLPSDHNVELGFGKHLFEAHAAEHRLLAKEIDIRGGQHIKLRLELEPVRTWVLPTVITAGLVVIAGVIAAGVYLATRHDAKASPAEPVTTDRTPVGVGIQALGARW